MTTAKKTKTLTPTMKGADLVPDMKGAAKEFSRVAFWVGCLDSAPVENVDIGGVNFPLENERVEPDPKEPGKSRRIPHAGRIAWMDRRKFDHLRMKLRQNVFRFKETPERTEERGTGENIGDAMFRASRGRRIYIPTEEELALYKKHGRAVNGYSQNERDEPAVRHLYAVPCADQDDPQPGSTLPDSLEMTGLEWPKAE